MNLNMNSLLWAALTVGGVMLAKKQRGIMKTGAYAATAYAGLRAFNSLTGQSILGLSGATIAIQDRMSLGGAPIVIENVR